MVGCRVELPEHPVCRPLNDLDAPQRTAQQQQQPLVVCRRRPTAQQRAFRVAAGLLLRLLLQLLLLLPAHPCRQPALLLLLRMPGLVRQKLGPCDESALRAV